MGSGQWAVVRHETGEISVLTFNFSPRGIHKFAQTLRPMPQQEDTNEITDEQSEGTDELYERLTIIIDKGQEPLRLDKFLTARIETPRATRCSRPSKAAGCW